MILHFLLQLTVESTNQTTSPPNNIYVTNTETESTSNEIERYILRLIFTTSSLLV